MNHGGYNSIFWETSWAHRQYYGWGATLEEADFQVLTKRQGPVSRHLVLTRSHDDAWIGRRMDALGLLGPLSTVALHDFSSADCGERIISGRTFRAADASQRLLNINTLAIDLARPAEDLWLAMKADNRRMCRKAEEGGTVVRASALPCREELDAFFGYYDRLARERNLATPEREVLERMFARGNLLLFAALNAEAYLNIILVYLARDKAYFLYGVSGAGRGDGAGQLIHWEAIKHLKNRGIAWYDLGGVPSTDSTNGIFLFKKSLGGELVSLGSEFFYCPAALQSLHGYYQRFRARV